MEVLPRSVRLPYNELNPFIHFQLHLVDLRYVDVYRGGLNEENELWEQGRELGNLLQLF